MSNSTGERSNYANATGNPYSEIVADNRKMKARITAQQQTIDNLVEALEDAINALEWWYINFPSGQGKEDEDKIQEFRKAIADAKK